MLDAAWKMKSSSFHNLFFQYFCCNVIILVNSNGVIGFNENGNLIRQVKGEDTANLPINHIKALALDNNNVLWIGTYKGLRILYNTANFFTEDVLRTEPIIILEEGIPKELLELQFITEIIVDGSNNKWISTADACICR